jgi:hypothetical protein
MVAGVEVWVQAQQQLGITSDLPAAAVALCCRQDWVSLHTAVLLPAWYKAFVCLYEQALLKKSVTACIGMN